MLFFKKKDYKEITIPVDGMKCGMCEAHVNDIIRKNFDVKNVKASARKNNVVIKYENDLDLDLMKEKLKEFGYDMKWSYSI